MPSLLDLEAEYNEMHARNATVGWSPSPNTGFTLAISTVGVWRQDPHTWPRLKAWLQTLGGQIYDPEPTKSEGQLHFTLQQCQPFTDIPPQQEPIDEYNIVGQFFETCKEIYNAQRYQEFLYKLGTQVNLLAGIKIVYRGLVITPHGLALRGFPYSDADYERILQVRENIREIFSIYDVNYNPPYKNTICHATVFRWTTIPEPEQIRSVIANIDNWKEAKIGVLQPHKWLYGFMSLQVKPTDSLFLREFHCPLRIAHRGLTGGPDKVAENDPTIIELRASLKQISECDVWFAGNRFGLGHDKFLYDITWDWLVKMSPYLLIHAKTTKTFHELLRRTNNSGTLMNIFYHTEEDVVLTTQGDCIVYPGRHVYDGWISMMPEHAPQITTQDATAICSDYDAPE